MELHQLRYLCAVAEAGSFTRAARLQHVTQPTLSQQIMKLEGELGSKFFHRDKSRIRLTDAGLKFLPTAKTILNLVEQAAVEFKQFSTQPKGAIVVGAIPTIAPYVLPALVKTFHSRYPRIEVRIVEDLQTRILPLLHQNLIDLAIVQLPLREARFKTRPLCRQSLYAVLPERHALANRKSLRLRELREENFLLLREGFQFRSSISEVFRAARIRPVIAFESLSFGNLLPMVAAGTGISLIPEMALEKQRGCRFIPVSELRAVHEIGWAVLKGHVLSPVHQLFVQELAQSVAGRDSLA